MTVLGGSLYFFGNNSTNGYGLFKTNGTIGDATFVTSLSSFSGVLLTSFDNHIYMAAKTGLLYVSTGDVGNKTLLLSLSADFDHFVNANGALYALDAFSSPAVVYRIKTGTTTPELISSIALPTAMASIGGDLYVSCATIANGAELFRLASGATTLTLVADIAPGKADSSPANLTAVGNKLFFTTGSSTAGYSLWVTAGSGATLLKVLSPAGDPFSPRIPAAVNGRYVVLADDPAAGAEFTTSDGTAAGSSLLEDIYPGTASSQPFIYGELNHELVMYASDAAHGTELWSLDANGVATLLQDINPGPASSFAASVYIAGNLAYFSASEGTTGAELYVTDASPGGTHMLADLNVGSASSSPSNFIAYNGLVYFDATDAAHGEEMWVTDGTAGGTKLFRDRTGGSGGFSNAGVMDGILYFSARDAAGKQLWRTDGTPQGTGRVKVINGSGDSSPSLLTAFNGSLYFVAADSLGAELWKSDGTDNGTVRLKDIRAGSSGASITSMLVAGGYLYFNANDGLAGKELWRTDGSVAGTIPLGDLLPGSGSSNPGSFAFLNDQLYFIATNSAGGFDLWQSSGTAATTAIVTNLCPAGETPPGGMVAAYGRLFFANEVPGVTYSVWSSDGTAAGTAAEIGIDPLGFPETYITRLIPFAGQIYVSADDGVNGIEPWRYTDVWAPTISRKAFDPTSGSTVLLTFNEDINLSASSLRLTNLTTGNDLPADEIQTSYDSAIHSLRVQFGRAGFVPADGNYRLTLAAGTVADLAGNVMAGDVTCDFFILAGDANHDRSVNFADLVAVAQNYGGTGKTYAQGDFDFDGIVSFSDLVTVAQKYGTTLTPPPAPAPSLAVASDDVLSPVKSEKPLIKATNPPVKRPAPVAKPVFATRRI